MSLLDDIGGMYDAGTQTLRLDAGRLGAAGAALAGLANATTFTFTGVASPPAETAGTIAIRGTGLTLAGNGPRLGFPAGKITAVSLAVYQADTTPVIVIAAQLAADWRFPDCFPWLANTFWADVALKPGAAPAPETLLLSTGAVHDAALGIDLAKGAAFCGALDETAGLLAPADWVLGASPKAVGPITLADNAPPSLTLTLDIANAKDGFAGLFHDLNVPLTARIVFETDPAVATESGLHLSGTFRWVGADTVLEVFLPGFGTGLAEFSVKGPLPLPGPDDLTRYLGGHSVTQYLPKEFSEVLDSIHVGRISLGIGLGTRKLEYAKVVLTTLENSTLTIVPHWVEISDIRFSVAVYFTESGNNVYYSLSGTFEIGGVDLIVSAQLVPTPRLTDVCVVMHLDQDDSIDLTAIAQKFGLPPGAPQILVDEFAMSASRSGTYFIRVGLSDHPVGPENNGFVLGHLVFELDYDGKTPNLSLQGMMEIAGVTCDLSMATDADGWLIQADAGGDQPIRIGDLIDDLAAKFGAKIPAPVHSLALRNVVVSYNTGTTAFFFTCEADFTVEATPVAVKLTVDIKPVAASNDQQAPKTYDSKFGGTITIGPLQFDLIFDSDPASTVFVATYSHGDTGAGSVSIHDLVAALSSDLASAIPADLKVDLKDVKFIFFQQDTTKQFAFGLDLSSNLSLSDLPLVGDKLPAGLSLGIDKLQFLYGSAAFTPEQVAAINPLLPQAVSPLPASVGAGINISAHLLIGAEPPRLLSVGAAPQPPSAQTGMKALAATTGGSGASTKWIDIEKQFGVFQFKRIGLGYHDGDLIFALDAAIENGPLTFSMDGLSLGSPLARFDPVFDLSGLGLSYVSGSIEITGALLKLPGDQLAPGLAFQFDGMAVVKAENYTLAAIGSYAQTKGGDPSLFVFAQLEAAIGGPPAFFVTGLMAGFGFNRTLEIPAQDEVMNFPLLALARSPATKQDPMAVLDILEGRTAVSGSPKQWIAPRTGEFWLAAGLEFRSFELVHSNALLVVEFGDNFEVALLGLSTMQLPQAQEGSTTYAYVQMQLRAVFKPNDGFFGATAILSSGSYVLTQACHLTGGFAFFLWFDPSEHAGEFVITLGGYHPAFKPPSYFPIVPRLGFNWAVSDTVSVTGEAYFALTTSCLMAGGGLDVQFHDGDLRAWFTAHADVLVSWRPFFFLADIDVSIGASYRLDLLFCSTTITVSLGASLEMWGPPTGGKVHIHLVVVSFTVHFGSDGAAANETPLQWADFKSLLPAPDTVCRVGVDGGLYKTQDSAKSGSGKMWIVRATGFSFATRSAIPASHLQYGGTPAVAQVAAPRHPEAAANAADAAPAIAIRPMNQTGVTSTHSLAIYKDDGSSKTPVDVSAWSLKPNNANVAESLWGAPPSPFSQVPGAPSANVIAGQTVGYSVQAPPPTIGESPGLVPLAVLREEYLNPGAAPLVVAPPMSPDYVPAFNELTVGLVQNIMHDDVKQKRDALYTALSATGIYAGANGSLADMAANAGHLFADAPMQQV